MVQLRTQRKATLLREQPQISLIGRNSSELHMPSHSTKALRGRAYVVVAVLILSVSLAACSSSSSIESTPPCTPVWILKDAAFVTRFLDGGGRDIIDVLHEGEITGFTETCEYDVDEETGIGQMQTEINTQITALRGPADRERAATVTYFIALTDLNHEVLEKKFLDVVIEFPGNRRKVKFYDEPVPFSIPISPERSAENYLIFIGFQVTQEEITYNRQQKGFR
jgi:hypothetical protein